MTDEPIQVQAEDSVLITVPIEAAFKFVSDPETMVDAITPLEAHWDAQGELALGSVQRCEIKIAGRVIHIETRVAVLEPPTRLVMEMQGDWSGEQSFTLSEEAGDARLNLVFKYWVPASWPSYYREEPTRTHFAETLVAQTLANIRTALEEKHAIRDRG